MQAVRILVVTLFTFLTCIAAGKTILKLLRAKLYRSEELFFGFVLGAACLSVIVLLLGVAGLAYPWVFLAVGFSWIAIAYKFKALHWTSERLPPLERPWSILFAALYGVFAILYLGNALSPEVSADGTLFHVALPALYSRAHQIPPITTNFLASFPEGMEMLFLFAFAFARHSAAAMVHLLFALMLPLGMLSYARRVGFPAAGVFAGLLFFLSPAAGQNGSVAYVDVAVATVVFAMFYLLQIWWTEQDLSLLIPLGCLAGFGYSIKYTAGLAVPYALAAIAFRLRRGQKPFWKPCATLALSAASLMLPWMIKNAIVVHNPVSPFANRVFRNPYLYVSTENMYARNMSSLHEMSLPKLPYEVTTRGGITQGFVGPIFLLAPLALFALASPAGRQLLCAALVFLVGFASYPVARLLLPALPFISLALGLVISRWRLAAAGLVLLHAILSWPAVFPKYARREAVRLEFPDWRAALRLTPETEFLNRHLAEYSLEQLLESNMASGDRAFSFRGFSQAYHSRAVLVEWQSALGTRLAEALRAAMEASFQPVERHDFHFPPRALTSIRLIQTTHTNPQWSISELRFFHNGSEVARSPAWRLHAWPNPWDVQLAFDSSPLTRWSSREDARPGMFVEVDFGGSQTIDEVRADCTPDQSETRMSLDGIPATLDVTHVDMPARLRRAAVEQLERSGVQWLVVHDLDPGARDFQTRQPQWGITLAGSAARFHLYRLE